MANEMNSTLEETENDLNRCFAVMTQAMQNRLFSGVDAASVMQVIKNDMEALQDAYEEQYVAPDSSLTAGKRTADRNRVATAKDCNVTAIV